MTSKPKITFGQYEKHFSTTDITNKASIAVMGLAGEIGDLLTEFKKELRGDIASKQRRLAICEETGDCLWYLTKICRVRGKSLSAIIGQSSRASIDVLQDSTNAMESLPKAKLAAQFILQLDKLVSSNSNNDTFEEAIREIASLLAATAKKYEFSFSEVADFNIKKTTKRFSRNYSSLKLFDEDFPEFEQIPRRLAVEIRQEKVGGELKTMLFIGKYIFGSPLQDNIPGTSDDFRYHDVFHLAFAANLGWSPNLRALLKRKRKSDPDKDKNEDGGRAKIIEEGIVHLVFRYGEENKFFGGKAKRRVDSSLLNTIEMMVKGYEVEDMPLSLWNKAICDAFRIFTKIKEHRQGKVSIDLKKRKILFEKLKIPVGIN